MANEPAKLRHTSANPNAPNAALYTAAVTYGNLVFLAAKTSWPAPEPNDIRKATAWVLDQVEKELLHAGSSMQQVLRVTVYLRDMADYAAMNEVYTGRFGTPPPPRTTVGATLPRESLVAVEVTAYTHLQGASDAQ